MRNWALLIYTHWLDLIGAPSRFAAKSAKAPPPDPNIGIAAQRQMDIGAQQQAFSERQYADQQKEIERLRPLVEKTMQGQIDMNDLQMRQAKDAEENYNKNFKPLEERFAADAAKAGTQAEQDLAAGAAGVDVQRQVDMQRDASGRAMASMGVNPNSGRFQGMDRSSQIMGAAAKVGAMNGAAAMEKNRGDQMRQNAISIGRGLGAHSLQASGQSGSSGAGAVGLGQTGFNMASQAGAQYMGGLNASANTFGQSASTYLGLHGANMKVAEFNAANSGLSNAMKVGGMAAGMASSWLGSDRRIKMNIREIGKTAGGHKLYSFQYRWGQPSRGVMADEVPSYMKTQINGVWHVDYSQVT